MWEKPWIDWNASQVAHPDLLYVPMDPNDASVRVLGSGLILNPKSVKRLVVGAAVCAHGPQ